MKTTLTVIMSTAIFVVCFARAFPDTRNPNLDYELINVRGPQGVPKNSSYLSPITPPPPQQPHVVNTPPPVDPNSKTFAFDPKSQTWTLLKKNDPKPDEDTLLWNKSNDKWLTQTARV